MNRCLLILLGAFLIFSCSTAYRPDRNSNPCLNHMPLSGSNRPIVCVDDRNLAHLTTNPYETWARKNSPIQWYTVSGNGGLSIAFENDYCVREVKCDGGANCHAVMRGDASTGTRCKYSITLTRDQGKVTEDPIIVVDSGMYEENLPPSQ